MKHKVNVHEWWTQYGWSGKKTKTKHFFPSLYVFQELSEWGTFQNDVIIKMHDVALSNIFNEQYQC